MNFKRFAYPCALLLLAGLVLPSQVMAFDAKGWTFSGGIYDTEETENPIEFGIEYRFEPKKLPLPFLRDVPLTPVFGFSATEDENFWGYGGLRYDWEFTANWYLTPQFGIALYEQGDGKDLGGVIEFRSGLEISRRLEGGSRLGLVFYHLSNASIYDLNPGSNSLVLTWSLGR